MPFQFDKPFKKIDGPNSLIKILEDRKLQINDSQYAKTVLSNTSYYTLHNGYKAHLTNDQEEYISGITIEMLQSIYMIDTDINSLILKNILFIEKTLKTKISSLIAEKYGVWTNYLSDDTKIIDDYLNENNYSTSGGKRLNTLLKIKDDLINCRPNTTTHYYKTNKNHVPPWILVNDISFGKAILWFRILKYGDKSSIVNSIIPSNNSLSQSDKNELFINCLLLLQNFRNIIAHGNRTFSEMIHSNLTFDSISKIFGNLIINKNDFDSGIGKNDFFSTIIAFCILMNDTYVFQSLGRDVVHLINKYSALNFGGKSFFEVFDIPDDILTKMQIISNLRY